MRQAVRARAKKDALGRGRMGRTLGVKQLRELFSFTDGPLPRVRSSETDDLHAVQSNTPSVAVIDDHQYSLHGHHHAQS